MAPLRESLNGADLQGLTLIILRYPNPACVLHGKGLIEVDLLSHDELSWLNTYHEEASLTLTSTLHCHRQPRRLETMCHVG